MTWPGNKNDRKRHASIQRRARREANLFWKRLTRWAWEGRTQRSQLIRLRIIGGLPTADIARECNVTTQAVSQQGCLLQSRERVNEKDDRKHKDDQGHLCGPHLRLSSGWYEDIDAFFYRLDVQEADRPWARKIRWALQGRRHQTQLIRLGIIAGVPVADIARQLELSPEAVFKQRRLLKSRLHA
jgi:hypothetical protein